MNNKTQNDWFKYTFPEEYEMGYRIAEDFGYILPEKIVERMKYPKRRCYHCKSGNFIARGLGVDKEPFWICESCMRIKRAEVLL